MATSESAFLISFMAGLAFLIYTYAGYPFILWLLGFFRKERRRRRESAREWPSLSIMVSAHNEESQIKGLLETLLRLDYPREKLQILIASDGSTDRTEELVEGFSDQGVELLRITERGGKTRAETEAAPSLTGEIIVNTDASIRIDSGALKHLVIALDDPSVGVATGRDVSVSSHREGGNRGEAGYVGYEMAVRGLETRVSGIVGASGSLYAIRSELHGADLPPSVSRDFASALIARESGFRAVSVPEAVCFVPRTPSLRREHRRKIRTIARGMDTLAFKRHLLNPIRNPLLAWMLFSHKICRWLVPWALVLMFVALGALSVTRTLALVPFLFGLGVLAVGALGWSLSERPSLPKFLAIPAYLVVGNLSAIQGFLQFLRRERKAVWEPTRRESLGSR